MITSFFAAKIWYKSIILLLYYPALFFYYNIIKFFIKRCISHVFQFLSEILYVDLSFTFRLFKLILNWQQISLWFLVSLRFVLLWRWGRNIKLGIFCDWRFNWRCLGLRFFIFCSCIRFQRRTNWHLYFFNFFSFLRVWVLNVKLCP